MATRNFWVTLNVDGRKSLVETGPSSKDGGFSLGISIRKDGAIIIDAIKMRGYVSKSGQLVLEVEDPYKDPEDTIIWQWRTNR